MGKSIRKRQRRRGTIRIVVINKMNIFAGHSDNHYALFMNTDQELKTSEYLKGIVSNLPEKPGIYQYLNAESTIIYVGKAKT